MHTHRPRRTLTCMLVGVLAFAGCGLGEEGTTLGDIKNKGLYLSYIAGPASYRSAQLSGDGCPLLIPGTVEATLNGHPMMVNPGHRGTSFTSGACYSPSFTIDDAPDDLGSVLTLVIKDSTQTLRAVVSGHHPQLPILDPAPTEPRVTHRGDSLSIPFTSPAEPPDQAHANFAVEILTASTGGGPCRSSRDAEVAFGNAQVGFQVPSDLCFGPAWVWVCAGYIAKPILETCENATCVFQPETSEKCQRYPLTIAP